MLVLPALREIFRWLLLVVPVISSLWLTSHPYINTHATANEARQRSATHPSLIRVVVTRNQGLVRTTARKLQPDMSIHHVHSQDR
jgi:hypothetical protein